MTKDTRTNLFYKYLLKNNLTYQFIRNAEEYGTYNKKDFKDIKQFILRYGFTTAFKWIDTREGYHFWNKHTTIFCAIIEIYQKQQTKEKQEQLIETTHNNI